MPLLELDNVIATYGKVQALRGLTLHVEDQEIVALLGANGAGKSTTMRTISGLITPQSGSLRFAGRDITGLKPEKIVRLGIAHVPEGRRVFPGLTVRENILLGASNHSDMARAEMESELERMFEIFPVLREFAHALGWRLSGGQQQMVAIARGLMARPKLLLLDEPSLGLAPTMVATVFRVIEEIRRQGVTVLMVEQNAALALRMADRAYVMESGRIALSGRAADLLDNAEVRRAYLGG